MSDILSKEQTEALVRLSRNLNAWGEEFAAKMNALGQAWTTSVRAAVADAVLKAEAKRDEEKP
ncbi:hypothetical protein [Nocardia abscessus]|uniref:hypothetical protein n=1 Tax=Nocardia abscessus TaxID=120957 RepID=UPI0003070C1D|nr:hypothetical protein [Nocardia abscessus]MCC3333571.1 hypothetical protein [Nocardia abscessus]